MDSIPKSNQYTISLIVLLFAFIAGSLNGFSQSTATAATPINICSSIFDEFAPSLSADGKTLIYQSNKDGEYKLYESKLQSNGQWSDPQPISTINDFGKKNDLVAGPSISYDGNTLFFCASYSNGYGNLDIYYSKRQGNQWGVPVNIGKTINSSEYEGFPCISSDGNKIYFTRLQKEKTEGQDCFKIMVTEKDKKGLWQTPKELPAPINMGCDKAPRIMPDNKTIVFASIREGGKGKFDLYTAKLNDAGEWEEPIPMEFVNSPDNDQYATVAASGDYMFYHFNNNIVSLAIPFKYRQNKNITVQGYVSDLDLKKPLEATITIKDAGTTQILSTATNNPSDGRYTVVLTAGKNYEITFSKPGFSSYTLEYDLTDLKEYKEYEANVELFSKINFDLSIIDDELYFPVNAQVSIKKAETSEDAAIKASVNEKGNKTYQMEIGNKYLIDVKASKYVNYAFTLDLTSEVKYKDLEKEVELRPTKKEFKFNLTDRESGEGLELELVITNLDINEQIVANASMSREGKYAINLREGNRYKVEVKNSKGYAFYASTLDVDQDTPNLNIGLMALKPNSKLLLKDIFFEYNSFELKEVSFEELYRVIRLLKENPNITVEVAAHSDNIGGEVFNKKLSDRRAKYVVDFMVEREVVDSRLKGVGYGKSMPIVPNDSEANRSKNRRLELKILAVN